MKIRTDSYCDVIVVGAGIAGVMAAMKAAENGASVKLLSRGATFSGSSFYPGTWGLGLIGPESEDDEQDLIKTIQTVGCEMTDLSLVRSLVSGITPAIHTLQQMGIDFLEPEARNTNDFIPCFDHKNRAWYGLIFKSVKEIFSKRLNALGVQCFPHAEVLELCQTDGYINGAVIYTPNSELKYIKSKVVVLATGGFGTLFKYHLNPEDVSGMGQYLALKAGGKLINLEFIQMMPGYIKPSFGTIFNERTFRYIQMESADGQNLFDNPHDQALLKIRSTHGPFTSRLPSFDIDLRLFKAFLADQNGVKTIYSPKLKDEWPEFIRPYFKWLKEKKHLTPDDPIYLGIFAHAANGGIKIDQDAYTGIPGLYACGEVTGGMHGADRIGGLSTANGLVFGIRAGLSAAEFSKNQNLRDQSLCNFDSWAYPAIDEKRKTMQDILYRYGMIERDKPGLNRALDELTQVMNGLKKVESHTPLDIAKSRRLEAQFWVSKAFLQAALLRTESRGSHYRGDYPQKDNQLNHRILIDYDQTLRLKFESGKDE